MNKQIEFEKWFNTDFKELNSEGMVHSIARLSAFSAWNAAWEYWGNRVVLIHVTVSVCDTELLKDPKTTVKERIAEAEQELLASLDKYITLEESCHDDVVTYRMGINVIKE